MGEPDQLSRDDPGVAAALAGRAPLRAGEVLRSAAESLGGSKRWILLGMLVWLTLALLATLLGLLLGLSDVVAGSLSVIATAPVTLALTMYAVRRVAGVPTDLAALLAYRPALGHAVVVLLMASLVLAGAEALLGTTWSVPVALAYGLLSAQAVFLVADRGADAFTAIAWSVRASLHVLPALVLVQFALAALVLVGTLAFGIGLIWAAPFAVLALGAVSLRLFGTRALDARERSRHDLQ